MPTIAAQTETQRQLKKMSVKEKIATFTQQERKRIVTCFQAKKLKELGFAVNVKDFYVGGKLKSPEPASTGSFFGLRSQYFLDNFEKSEMILAPTVGDVLDTGNEEFIDVLIISEECGRQPTSVF